MGPGDAPILFTSTLRRATAAAAPVQQAVDEETWLYAFLAQNLGLSLWMRPLTIANQRKLCELCLAKL